MKIFIALFSFVAVCNAAHLRLRRHADLHSWSGSGGHGGHPQRFRLSAAPRGSNPVGANCPKPALPEREPIVLEQKIPGPFNVNFGAQPKVIEHNAVPTQIDYFEKPTVINHQKDTRLNVYSQTPVVVDTFDAPAVSEQQGPNLIQIEQVAGDAGGAGGAGGSGGAGGAGGFGGMGGKGHHGHPIRGDHPGHLEPAPCH